MTGIIVAVVVTRLMKRFRLRDFRARGFAVGLGSHGIGTARAFQVDQVAGTGIAMGLNALLATILVPSRSRRPSGEGAHQCLARACAWRVTLFTGPPRPPTAFCSDRAIVTIVRGRGACPRGGQPRHLSSLSEAGSYLVQTLSSRCYSIWLSTSFVYALHTIWPPLSAQERYHAAIRCANELAQ